MIIVSQKKHALFIFRRDLRISDNTALIAADNQAKKISLLFIFDPRQIETHAFYNPHAIQFMLDSISDLVKQIQAANGNLNYLFGHSEEIVRQLLSQKDEFDALYINRDYTPFSRKRDGELRNICQKQGLTLYLYGDYMINEPDSPSTLKKDGNPYTVFTPFYKNSLKIAVDPPQHHKFTHFQSNRIDFENEYRDLAFQEIAARILPEKSRNKKLIHQGGRTNALKILSEIEKFAEYKIHHDIPAIHGTSRLAPHLKFGTCSIRETYHAIRESLGVDHPIMRQLYWRDFFTQIGYHFPRVFGNTFVQKYNQLKWNENAEAFLAWCSGKTGFPIVDAGIRELNTTGFMHNRVRMIVASFLTKDLHIDWRKGEKYFAQKLTDYDPAVNNGNWQWAASTGCDATPYFRIFNPWIQQQKFDPDCLYIKNWIPELTSIPARIIHNLYKKFPSELQYPKPMLVHEIEAKKAVLIYKSISQAENRINE